MPSRLLLPNITNSAPSPFLGPHPTITCAHVTNKIPFHRCSGTDQPSLQPYSMEMPASCIVRPDSRVHLIPHLAPIIPRNREGGRASTEVGGQRVSYLHFPHLSTTDAVSTSSLSYCVRFTTRIPRKGGGGSYAGAKAPVAEPHRHAFCKPTSHHSPLGRTASMGLTYQVNYSVSALSRTSLWTTAMYFSRLLIKSGDGATGLRGRQGAR